MVSRHSPLTAGGVCGGESRQGSVSHCSSRDGSVDNGLHGQQAQPLVRERERGRHPPSSASSSFRATDRAGWFCSRAAMMRCRAAASTCSHSDGQPASACCHSWPLGQTWRPQCWATGISSQPLEVCPRKFVQGEIHLILLATAMMGHWHQLVITAGHVHIVAKACMCVR